MNIEIQRQKCPGCYWVDGIMMINGKRVCSTLENAMHSIPAGKYMVTLDYNEKYGRNMPTLRLIEAADGGTYDGRPVIGIGNGAYALTDGTILVGERQTSGLVIKSRDVFLALYARIKMALHRNRKVILILRGRSPGLP